MSIIVPPALTRLTKADPRAIQAAAARVVKASSPGTPRPPKFASLVGNREVKLADGFSAALTGDLAKGAEYGGRRRPKKAYLTNRKGHPYSVRRRTTMQFLPHNSRGYALTPATRRSMAGIRARILEAVRGAVT